MFTLSTLVNGIAPKIIGHFIASANDSPVNCAIGQPQFHEQIKVAKLGVLSANFVEYPVDFISTCHHPEGIIHIGKDRSERIPGKRGDKASGFINTINHRIENSIDDNG